MGVHEIRSSDAAISTSGTLKYIQYLPFTFAARHRSATKRQRIAPDLVSMRMYFPPGTCANAGPCFTQVTRSRDVATDNRGTSRFQAVYVSTYSPFSRSTIRGSSTPPGHSYALYASLSG